jgi:hypothetical protein
MHEKENYSRFLFRATGDRDMPGPLDDLGLSDNLRGELDRLHAISELLDYAQANPVPPGLPELVRDIWERATWLLDLWERGKKRERKP